MHLPTRSTQSTNLPTLELRRVGAFLFAILNAAKDWQDTLQRKLPGFAERTVEIRLDETKEGGMNLAMGPEVIEKLGELGREAGRLLVADFDLDENRWRRAMSVLPEIESGLEAYAEAWREVPVGTAAMPYEVLLTDYDQKTITAATGTWRRETLAPFARRLAELGDEVAGARADPDRDTVQDGPRPGQDASMRLLADADRQPRSRQGAGRGADA